MRVATTSRSLVLKIGGFGQKLTVSARKNIQLFKLSMYPTCCAGQRKISCDMIL
jgi:hypothetical protein